MELFKLDLLIDLFHRLGEERPTVPLWVARSIAAVLWVKKRRMGAERDKRAEDLNPRAALNDVLTEFRSTETKSPLWLTQIRRK